MPLDIVARLGAELARMLNTQNLKKRLAALVTEVRSGTPESFAALMRDN